MLPYRFYELPFFDKNGFVFDFCGCDPGLDLVPQPLKFFDLLFEVLLIFFFLIAVRCMVDFVPSVVKFVYAFGDLFQAAVYFRCKIKIKKILKNLFHRQSI